MSLLPTGADRAKPKAKDEPRDLEEMVTGIRETITERLQAAMQSHEVQDLHRDLHVLLDDLSVELRKLRPAKD